MTPWKPVECAWCGAKLVHRTKGGGRPRKTCDAECARALHNHQRRQERALLPKGSRR